MATLELLQGANIRVALGMLAGVNFDPLQIGSPSCLDSEKSVGEKRSAGGPSRSQTSVFFFRLSLLHQLAFANPTTFEPEFSEAPGSTTYLALSLWY